MFKSSKGRRSGVAGILLASTVAAGTLAAFSALNSAPASAFVLSPCAVTGPKITLFSVAFDPAIQWPESANECYPSDSAVKVTLTASFVGSTTQDPWSAVVFVTTAQGGTWELVRPPLPLCYPAFPQTVTVQASYDGEYSNPVEIRVDC